MLDGERKYSSEVLNYSGLTMNANSLTFTLQDSRPRAENDSVSATHNWAAASKVPEVAIAFWVIKIAATTLGETGGDALSMTMNLGYLLSTVIFMACFVAALAVQVKAKAFHPFLYWTVIVTTTTVGTTMADYADRC